MKRRAFFLTPLLAFIKPTLGVAKAPVSLTIVGKGPELFFDAATLRAAGRQIGPTLGSCMGASLFPPAPTAITSITGGSGLSPVVDLVAGTITFPPGGA